MRVTKRERICKTLIYQQVSPDGEIMEARILKACNMYANSDIDIRTLSRTFDLTERFFIRCIKKVYFFNALPEEDLNLLLNRLLSEKIIGMKQLRADFDKIDELKTQYKKLQAQKQKFDLILKDEPNGPNNEKLMQNVCEISAKMKEIKYDKVFISF